MSLTVPASGEFPVLEREAIAYLDSAATSQTPRSVIEAMDRYYLEARATVHRSTYALAAEATEMFEGARDRIAAFTGSTPGETIFTRNATEAINLVAWSYLGGDKKNGVWDGFDHTYDTEIDPRTKEPRLVDEDYRMLMRDGGAGYKIPFKHISKFRTFKARLGARAR